MSKLRQYSILDQRWINGKLLFWVGVQMNGQTNFLVCSDTSMNLKLKWIATLGKQFQNSVVIMVQIFIIVEFVIYIILFKYHTMQSAIDRS